MKHAFKAILKQTGRRIFFFKSLRLLTMALAALSVYLILYFSGVLLIKSMSLTWVGLLVLPAVIGLVLLLVLPYYWWYLNDPRRVARHLEHKFPELQLSVRSSLDFLEGKADRGSHQFRDLYVKRVLKKLEFLDEDPADSVRPWGRYALLLVLGCAAFWGGFRGQLMQKFYNPKQSFGQTHFNLEEGSITIFEPEYTQIPGRTLPLRPGRFSAYPGSKVRFLIKLPPRARGLHLSTQEDEEAVPLRINEERFAGHEFVLVDPLELRFFLSEKSRSSRTEPYLFEVKTDAVPEVQLRGHTPEGVLNLLDPLIISSEVKDDFGVKQLQAVVTWPGGEKRLPIEVSANRKKHFITRNQWHLSDLGLDDVDSFSVYFEAVDNNPINGPGIGRSQSLHYQLESPEKKYDEFMAMARELLDTMTHTLGDNLETHFATTLNMGSLTEAEAVSKDIGGGLFRSLSLTNNLLGKMRSTPNLSRLDQSFLQEFRGGLSKQVRFRTEMELLYNNLRYRSLETTYRRLLSRHYQEETQVEGLTYELLLQLKLWAVLDLERQNAELRNELERLEELLENSENLNEQELMEMFNKLMDEVMKDFQKMMAKAAQEMNMSPQEFMNSEAMMNQTDELKNLRQEIMEALRQGDMEKARSLMEQLKAQMESAVSSMKQSMSQMSPEMQQMMKNMRELTGLLRELKAGEEDLEGTTRDLKRNLDQEMGGNNTEFDEQNRQKHTRATERIHELLTELYNKLVEYKSEDLSRGIIKQIFELKQQLESGRLETEQEETMRREISRQERLLNILSKDGLERLKNLTLRNLDQTEKFQEYLDQGELLLSLEVGLGLESLLVEGERLSGRNASSELREEAHPKETFQEAREELYTILDALRNVRGQREEKRRRFMEGRQEQRQQDLAQRQEQLDQMIREFLERTKDSFDGSQVAQKLEDIGLSMKNAERKLRDSRLEGGIQFEQEALQKIGEMMEQLQQSQQPNNGGANPMPMNMRLGRREGMYGDPSTEDIFIPESQKRVSKDQMKDAIRKRLEKNLPESYGKEIRKYYEKLMDQ